MKRIANLAGILDGLIQYIEIVVLSSCVLMMAINSIANVMARYLLQNSLFFSEELNQFLMLLITFIGLGYVTRKGRHIRMSAIYDVLGERFKKYLMIIICLSTAAVMFFLAYFAYEYIVKLVSRGQVTPALRIPVYLTLICVPMGFVITGIQYLLAFIKNLLGDAIYLSYSEVDAYEESDCVESKCVNVTKLDLTPRAILNSTQAIVVSETVKLR